MTYKSCRRKILTSALIVGIGISVAGCATQGGFKYILPSRQDVLTEGTKKQIIEHNEFCDQQQNCTRP